MFSDNLQNFRKQKGYSQEQLAEMLGVSRQTIYNWESGASYPDVEKLVEISQLMGCTLDELVREKVDLREKRKPSANSELRHTINQIYKKFALSISTGVFLVLTSVSLLLLFHFYDRIQHQVLTYSLVGIPIVIAILLFIYSGMRFNSFRETTKEDVVFSKEERHSFFTRFSLHITIGIGLILIGIFILIVSYPINSEMIWPTSVSFFITGLGIAQIIYQGIQLSKFSDYGERDKPKLNKFHEKTMSVIMLVATLIFLACGFIWHLWHIAWIVYVFAGILSQIIYVITKND